MDSSFDTTFLIDLHRNIGSQNGGPAARLLAQYPDAALKLSVIGFGAACDAKCKRVSQNLWFESDHLLKPHCEPDPTEGGNEEFEEKLTKETLVGRLGGRNSRG
jgi:hypothetical protein